MRDEREERGKGRGKERGRERGRGRGGADRARCEHCGMRSVSIAAWFVCFYARTCPPTSALTVITHNYQKNGESQRGKSENRKEKGEVEEVDQPGCLLEGVAVFAGSLGSVVALHSGEVRGTAGTHHPPTPPAVMPTVELQRQDDKRCLIRIERAMHKISII